MGAIVILVIVFVSFLVPALVLEFINDKLAPKNGLRDQRWLIPLLIINIAAYFALTIGTLLLLLNVIVRLGSN